MSVLRMMGGGGIGGRVKRDGLVKGKGRVLFQDCQEGEGERKELRNGSVDSMV